LALAGIPCCGKFVLSEKTGRDARRQCCRRNWIGCVMEGQAFPGPRERYAAAPPPPMVNWLHHRDTEDTEKIVLIELPRVPFPILRALRGEKMLGWAICPLTPSPPTVILLYHQPAAIEGQAGSFALGSRQRA
jgi:hypothetical protein